MKKIKLLLLSFLFAQICNSQIPEKIRFARDKRSLYFFQEGEKRDTIKKDDGDRFYLIIPDTLKENLLIQTQNSKLDRTENDSIYCLTILPGLQYESGYLWRDNKKAHLTDSLTWKTLMNGVSALEKSQVSVTMIDRKKNKVLLKNLFFIKP